MSRAVMPSVAVAVLGACVCTLGCRPPSAPQPPQPRPPTPPTAPSPRPPPAPVPPQARFDASTCQAGAPASIYVDDLRELDWCNLDFGLPGFAFTGAQAVEVGVEQGPEASVELRLVEVIFGPLDRVAGDEAVALVERRAGEQSWAEVHVFTLGEGAVHVARARLPFAGPLELGRDALRVTTRDASAGDCVFELRVRPGWQLTSGDYRCRPGPASAGAATSSLR